MTNEKTILWRILTEHKNEEQVVGILDRYFPGCTLIRGAGRYQSHWEKALLIEIATEDQAKVMAVAREIKSHNQQHSVLVQRIPIVNLYV